MKREFNVGETAHMVKNMRAKGFMLKIGMPVKILGYYRIEDSAGIYSYTIEVEHPKTKEKVVLIEWVSQYDLYPKKMWERDVAQKKEIERLEKLIEKTKAEKGVE